MEIQEINEEMMWILFQGMVCTQLVESGFIGDAWQMASCLDMSFDEVRDNDIEHWAAIISGELEEYRHENPENFKSLH